MDDSNLAREWLEADGLGGFASGTIAGVRTRRYHALLLAATTPPTGRMVLVNGFDLDAISAGGRFALSSHRYAPDVLHPDGARRIVQFTREPWPHWQFELPDGTRIEQELFAVHGSAVVVLRWRVLAGSSAVRLTLRPLLSGRDYHALHRENSAARLEAEGGGQRLRFQLYPDVPAILSCANAAYQAQPDWYRNFAYHAEEERGLDHLEDLACPGVLSWDLARGPAVWVIGAEGFAPELSAHEDASELAERLAARERERRASFATPWHRAADAYLVGRGQGRTIVAGYPWFTDWGRDTFIAVRGLCIATGQLTAALAVLRQWADAVSFGMLPNRFPDRGESAEYNSVDASLWYIIAVHDLLRAYDPPAADRAALIAACDAILSGYAAGTRHGIHLDADGLLACGEPGVQLTWMDAKIGDWVVTPRTGKPVEVQALWLNALAVGGSWSQRWRDIFERGRTSFAWRFWNDARDALFDVVDVDHQPGRCDASLRPNQILAVGGLPIMLVPRARAERVVDSVEQQLLTPLGLRSLAPDAPGYAAHYLGSPAQRDAVYHQGTVWPWLLGPFVEAWVRVRGSSERAKREARTRFLSPLLAYVEDAGLGHLCEIADAEAPHTPRGCPFQAWSLAEALRLEFDVLAEPTAGHMTHAPASVRDYSRRRRRISTSRST